MNYKFYVGMQEEGTLVLLSRNFILAFLNPSAQGVPGMVWWYPRQCIKLNH